MTAKVAPAVQRIDTPPPPQATDPARPDVLDPRPLEKPLDPIACCCARKPCECAYGKAAKDPEWWLKVRP